MPRRFNKRRVRRYGSCPSCDAWSILVQPNGRIVRHSSSFGYVEKLRPDEIARGFRNTPICEGSGSKIMESLQATALS